MSQSRQKRVNQVQVQLYNIAKTYVVSQVDKEFHVPEFLAYNAEKWSAMFLSQKNIQSLFLDFHARLEQLLKAEMHQNRG